MPLLNTSALGPARAVIRRAQPADLPRLVAAADLIFRTPFKAGLGSMGRDYPLLFSAENAENLYVAESTENRRNGEPSEPPAIIGHTGFTLGRAIVEGHDVRVACLGAVFTLPDHRNQGLATQLLGEAVAGARAAGAELGLVSGARNLYASAGFGLYPAVHRYRLSGAANAANVVGARGGGARLELEPYQPSAIADLARLHESEPVRFVRSTDQWQRLLAARVVFFEPGAVFAVRSRGERVAYLAVGRPPSEDGLGQQARVLEIAGDRAAIAEAAPLLLEALEVSTLDILMPTHDLSLEPHARQHGWSRDEVQLPFSAAWWNPSLAHLPLPFYGLNYV